MASLIQTWGPAYALEANALKASTPSWGGSRFYLRQMRFMSSKRSASVTAALQPQPSEVQTPDPKIPTHELIKWTQPEVSNSLPRAENSDIGAGGHVPFGIEKPTELQVFYKCWKHISLPGLWCNGVKPCNIYPQEFKAAPFSCQSIFSAGLHLWGGTACCAEVLKVLPPE